VVETRFAHKIQALQLQIVWLNLCIDGLSYLVFVRVIGGRIIKNRSITYFKLIFIAELFCQTVSLDLVSYCILL
jgi:hypothetical protein